MVSKSQLVQPAAALAALLLVTPVANAQEAEADARAEATSLHLASGLRYALRLEPGLAVALSEPQSEATEPGFAQAVKLFFGVTPYLELGPSVAVTTLPATSSMADSGTSWTFGGGVRLMRPHDAAGGRGGLEAISPWVDADALYVRTGELDRPGFAAAVGVTMPLDRDRNYWLGPFVRYSHILQGERADFDNRDAKILSIGLSLELGSGVQRARPRAVVAAAPATELAAAPPAVASDRDGDSVLDRDDDCPDVAGRVENAGCAPYQRVAVLPDKLEVKDKIAFKWDSATLDEASYPALDEVVRVLQDNPGFRVEVEGHASSDGLDTHNQTLSEQRATRVVDYLVAGGVARDRLVAKGFSSSVPVSTNRTAAGRVTNRRVEFVVHLILVNDRSAP
jgi:outer membrane protein OmpA-like peptidoglycan-associated protein